MTDDEQHLDLLAVFHFIVGGFTALFACVPILHLVLGLGVIFGEFDGPNPPPAVIGWAFTILAAMFILCGWALAIGVVVAGFKLKKRTAWTYCLVIAGLECMMMPFGTVLGVFTVVVLLRDSVKQLFKVRPRSGAAAVS